MRIYSIMVLEKTVMIYLRWRNNLLDRNPPRRPPPPSLIPYYPLSGREPDSAKPHMYSGVRISVHGVSFRYLFSMTYR